MLQLSMVDSRCVSKRCERADEPDAQHLATRGGGQSAKVAPGPGACIAVAPGWGSPCAHAFSSLVSDSFPAIKGDMDPFDRTGQVGPHQRVHKPLSPTRQGGATAMSAPAAAPATPAAAVKASTPAAPASASESGSDSADGIASKIKHASVGAIAGTSDTARALAPLRATNSSRGGRHC